MAAFKLRLGLVMTVVLLGIAGARLGFLNRVDLDDALSSGSTSTPMSEQ